MHCHICDKDDDQITLDRVTMEFSPCPTCQAAIQECLEGYDAEDEDEAEY